MASERKLQCTFCKSSNLQKASAMKCNSCFKYVYYHCSGLPTYMIHVLELTNRKYDCEKCVMKKRKYWKTEFERIDTEIANQQQDQEIADSSQRKIQTHVMRKRMKMLQVIMQRTLILKMRKIISLLHLTYKTKTYF